MALWDKVAKIVKKGLARAGETRDCVKIVPVLNVDTFNPGQRIGTWMVCKNDLYFLSRTTEEWECNPSAQVRRILGARGNMSHSITCCNPKSVINSWRLWAEKVWKESTEWNHSFNQVWSGRLCQLRSDLQPPNKSKLCAAMKCLTSVTFIFLLAWEGNPLILQNPIQRKNQVWGRESNLQKGDLYGKPKNLETGDQSE